MGALMRLCQTTMEWNTNIPEIKNGITRWFELPNNASPSSYFLHFSTQGSILSSYSMGYSPWRSYVLIAPIARKAGFLGKKVNWESFDFALNNAKFHNPPGFPAELFSVDIYRNPTKNRNYGDSINFNMHLPFPSKYHPATIRGWVEGRTYPGSDLINFRDARILLL